MPSQNPEIEMAKLEWWAGDVGADAFRLGWGRTREACLAGARCNCCPGDRIDLVQAETDYDAELDADDCLPFSAMSERETLEWTGTEWLPVATERS